MISKSNYPHLILRGGRGLWASHAWSSHRRPGRRGWRPRRPCTRRRAAITNVRKHIKSRGEGLCAWKFKKSPSEIGEPLPDAEFLAKDVLHVFPHLGNPSWHKNIHTRQHIRRRRHRCHRRCHCHRRHHRRHCHHHHHGITLTLLSCVLI